MGENRPLLRHNIPLFIQDLFFDSQKIQKRLANQETYKYNRNAMNYDIQDICNLIIKSGHKHILISGNGASGKSTLAHNLSNMLQDINKTVSIFRTDDFMLDKEYRKKTLKTYIGKDGTPKTQYMSSTFPEAYDFLPLLSALETNTSDIVIIEGIGAALLTEQLPNSYKIFVQTDKETEFQRRLCRARSSAD
ncbi:MAG: hypothetical protein J6T57_02380, partial [Alphaproteobacteria bacterium]|nr:hypothetical protein [Alphaproteobacteria bacterium]